MRYYCLMENLSSSCDHRWRYFVHVQSRAVRGRECERCGLKSLMPKDSLRLSAIAQPAVPERLSA